MEINEERSKVNMAFIEISKRFARTQKALEGCKWFLEGYGRF
jgi:hypothetical protein